MLKNSFFGVRIVKNTGKYCNCNSFNDDCCLVLIIYISRIFNMTIASISIFVLMLLRLAPVTQNLANQRTAIASAQPSFDNILKY